MRFMQVIGIALLAALIGCSGQSHVRDSDSGKGAGDPAPVSEPDAISGPEPSHFALGVGDEIEISVWRNNDLNRTVTVDPDGNIYLPMAGEIHAEGMSINELRETVAERLSKYIINPVVDINATTIQSQKYYILGEVKAPGVFRYKQQTNLMGGVVQAGGFTLDADLNKVLLLRNDKGVYRPRALDLDIEDISQSAQLAIATNLQNGDIVYVPPKFIADLERFMKRFNNIIVPIVNLERAIVTLPDVWDVITKGEVQRDSNTGAIVPP
jgi:polysaccharide export outer membrane protein